MVGLCYKAEKNEVGAVLSVQYDTDKALNVILLDQLFKVDEFIDWFEDNDNYVEIALQGVIEKDYPLVTNLKVGHTTQTRKYYA